MNDVGLDGEIMGMVVVVVVVLVAIVLRPMFAVGGTLGGMD
jgi:hypothetical protein